jgi:hypothetical protein
MLIVGFGSGATGSTFEVVASLGGLLLMMKFLGFLQILSIRLATFVLALGIIASDMVSFLAVLGVAMLGFGYAFFMLIGYKTVPLHDDEPGNMRARYARNNNAIPMTTTNQQPFAPLFI